MLKINSTFASLLVASLAAVTVAAGVEHWRSTARSADRGDGPSGRAVGQGDSVGGSSAMAAGAAPRTASGIGSTTGGWVASAPGRVEPRGGEIRIGAQMPGKVAQVLVRMNDTVKAGDLLVRLVDDEPAVKLAAAQAEVAVRRRERDGEPAVKLAADRRVAEDAASVAERTVQRVRFDLDRLLTGAVGGASPAVLKEIEAGRTALVEANDKLEADRVNLRRVQAQVGMPLPTRLEASLATARSELGLVETALERARIRAPADGTVLQVNTRPGETVTPSPEDILVVFGDLSALKVRAEVEERDLSKVRTGQAVVVRSDAFPGQQFAGTVERMAQSLGPPRMSAKGPRRPSEQDVLQVMIDLEPRSILLPGMRVDVFFKPDATVGAAAAAAVKTN